jgi:hypothetical protein
MRRTFLGASSPPFMDNNEGVKRNAMEQKERSKKGKTIKFLNNKIVLLFFKVFC